MQLRVAGAIDLAHTANAERADDLVRADVCAGRQRHEVIGAAAAGDGGRPAGLYRSRVDIGSRLRVRRGPGSTLLEALSDSILRF